VTEIFRYVVVLTNLFMVYAISEQALAILRPASIMMETKIYRFCFAELFHTPLSSTLFLADAALIFVT